MIQPKADSCTARLQNSGLKASPWRAKNGITPGYRENGMYIKTRPATDFTAGSRINEWNSAFEAV